MANSEKKTPKTPAKKSTAKKKTTTNKKNVNVENEVLAISVPPPPTINKPIISDIKIITDKVKDTSVKAKKVLTQSATSETEKVNETELPKTETVVESDKLNENISVAEINKDAENEYKPEKEQESFMIPIEELQRRITEAAKGKSKEDIIKSAPQPQVQLSAASPITPPIFNQPAVNNQTASLATSANELSELILENDFSSSAEAFELVSVEDVHFRKLSENIKNNYLKSFSFNMRKSDFEKILPEIQVSYFKGGIVLTKGKFNYKIFCQMNFY
jgi:hypothetical protein